MTIRVFGRCALFLALFFVGLEFVCAFIPDQTNLARLTLNELRAEPGHIDTLLIGTSHVYSDVDPTVLTTALGGRTHDLGSADQTPIDSYYLLLETLKQHTIGTLVLEVNARNTTWDAPLFGHTQKLLTSMPLSRNKLQYHRAAMGHPLALDGLYRASLRHDDVVRGITQLALFDKLKPSYRRPPVGLDYEYMGGGFMRYETKLDRDAVIEPDMLDPESFQLNPIQADYLNRIATRCEAEGIDLVLVTYPSHDALIVLEQAPMQQAHDAFAAFAKARSLAYLDYNLLSPGALNLTDAAFRDIDHMNGDGAGAFSRRLAEDLVLLRQGEAPDGFCANYAERTAQVDSICGLGIEVLANAADGYVDFIGRPVMGRGDARVIECRFVVLEGALAIWDSGWGGQMARWACAAGRYDVVGYARTAGGQRDYEAVQKVPLILY